MTDNDILNHCLEKNPFASQKDVTAFRILMYTFDCEDSSTPGEADERITASIRCLREDLHNKSAEEAMSILDVRLAKLMKGEL